MRCGHSGKKQKRCWPKELEVGDCWIAISWADSSGLILAARVGKHTDDLLLKIFRNVQVFNSLAVVLFKA